jgi:polyisoprenoid-binding protein YceI
MSWQIDTSHSTVQFSVRHMMLSKTRGEFEKFSGTVDLNEANPAASAVEVQIDASSINTRDERRDEHLRSPDFLDAGTYPHLTFKSTSVEVLDSEHAKLHGDLTIKNITKPVTMNVEYTGKSKSPWGTENIGFEVGDDVQIDIELELVNQP